MRRFVLALPLVLLGSAMAFHECDAAGLDPSGGENDSSGCGCITQPLNWLSLEAGIYELRSFTIDDGGKPYQRLSFALSINPWMGVLFSVDRWKYSRYRTGDGIGIVLTPLRMGCGTLSVSPTLFGGHDVIGVSFPVTIGYELPGQKVRIQATGSYRNEQGFESTERSFYTWSIGVGVALNKVIKQK